MSVQETITMMEQLTQATAGTAEDHYLTVPNAGEWMLKKAYINVSTTVATDSSDYVTIALKQGATTVASYVTSAGALTAGTAQALTNAAAGASAVFGQGDTIHLDVDKAGSGKKCVGTVTVSLQAIVS
jgi:hypothetical protein